MTAMPIVIISLVVFALAYRFYFTFIAARVAVLNDLRTTPSSRLYDGQNYHPMSKWVLFGHHFAAIAGAGPLVGPVLAAQFGFFPGFAWMLVGAVMAGAVHDFIILTASTRHDGKSLAEIARREIGTFSGLIASIAILIIIIIALAGLGRVVVNALCESPWGMFTIAATIPIAVLMGFWMFRFRKGKTGEATAIGVALLSLAVILGKYIPGSPIAGWFSFERDTISILIAVYGLAASILPVWVLLSPRDYLSSIMKLGVIAMLAIGVIVVAPTIQMPAVTPFISGGGPIFGGPLFPFLFITIACGAVSGFHSLVSSGTTPKMVIKESHIKPIAVGSMLAEGMVSILALIAATSLQPLDYFMINAQTAKMQTFTPKFQEMGFNKSDIITDLSKVDLTKVNLSKFDLSNVNMSKVDWAGVDMSKVDWSKVDMEKTGLSKMNLARVDISKVDWSKVDFKAVDLSKANLPKVDPAKDDMSKIGLSSMVGENIIDRPGGAVSLAVGMAKIFSSIPGLDSLMSYWYHFAIMFEALFILTTIDAGTRIARFIFQEAVGKIWKPFARTDWLLANVVASVLVVFAWGFFLYTGSIESIWPMFGTANQLLAAVALAIGTSFIINRGRAKYAWVTILPMIFVGVTTLTAGYLNITNDINGYIKQMSVPKTMVLGTVNLVLTAVIMICVVLIVVDALPKWIRAARGKPIYVEHEPEPDATPAPAKESLPNIGD